MLTAWQRLAPAVAALALAACQSSTGATPSPEAAAAGPKVPRVVLAVVPPATETNEPRHHSGTTSWQLDPSYEFLVGLDPDTGKFIPQLATAWSIGADGRSIEFKLRQNVPFHGGYGMVGVDDVRTTWRELTREDSLAGARPFFKEWVTAIDSADEGRSVVFRLRGPTAEFVPSITQERAGMEVISNAFMEKSGQPSMQTTPPAGTAPYQFKERRQGSYVRFERVPYQHWRITPDFPEIELRFMKEASTRLASLLAGEVQLADLPEDLKAEALQRPTYRIAEAKAPSARVWVQLFGVYYNDIDDFSKGFVYPETPMTDVRVRKALSKAVNRDELNRAFFGGQAKPMHLNNFTPNWPGWNAEWERRFSAEYGYDLPAAKSLLAEAGFGPGRPYSVTFLVLPVAGLSSGGDIAEAVAGYWRAAGVNVELTPMDSAASSALQRALKLTNHSRLTATGSNIWTGTSTYSSGTKATRSGGIAIPAADAPLAEAVATLDERKQDDQLRKAGNAWYDAHVDVPLFWLPAEIVVNRTIVADYRFPGNVTGLWSHVEHIKAAR